MLHHAVLQKKKKIQNISAEDKERYVPSHIQGNET